MFTPSTEIEDIQNIDAEIDFDAWMKMHQSSPEEFEKCRAALIDLTIKSAPEHLQRRLNGLQFQIDMNRSRTNSSLQGCINISSMMWAKFDELNIKLNELKNARDPNVSSAPQPVEPPVSAEILKFIPR